MIDNWFEVSPWELAFLAGADGTTPTLLDRVSTVGHWLGPDYQRAGEASFAQRVASMPADPGVEFWEILVTCARLFVMADRGTVLTTSRVDEGEDLLLITAFVGEVVSQLAVKRTGSAIRPLASAHSPELLASEVLRAGASDVRELTLLRWSSVNGTSGKAWRPNESPNSLGDALDELSKLALFVDAPR